jgi:selenocysteine lyase/cysteine desulfurase
VGYAAHRLIDVKAWDVDFYAFSFYKVYGPHYAALYGKRSHLLALPGINHYFIGEAEIPYKFQPGNVNFELSYSMVGLCDYLSDLACQHGVAPTSNGANLRSQMVEAFELISQHEDVIGDRLLSYLSTKPNVRILGEPKCDRHRRVPTIAFVVNGVNSATIPPQIDPHAIAIRYGESSR